MGVISEFRDQLIDRLQQGWRYSAPPTFCVWKLLPAVGVVGENYHHHQYQHQEVVAVVMVVVMMMLVMVLVLVRPV